METFKYYQALSNTRAAASLVQFIWSYFIIKSSYCIGFAMCEVIYFSNDNRLHWDDGGVSLVALDAGKRTHKREGEECVTE